MNHLRRLIAVALSALVTLTLVASPAPSYAIQKDVIKLISKASVQLGPVALVTKNNKQSLTYIGWGSGTVVSADGLILTNHHVTDVSDLVSQTKNDKNTKIVDGTLMVLFTTRSDQPPQPGYLAEVVADSPELDLAVLRITRDLNGKPVDPKKLNLPFAKLGDSDTIEIGDELAIFGYPAIGGDTITYTSGPVSGFAAEGKVRRAWIKTSASISGGNSGGTGVDADGNLVGVPTQAGTGSANETVDCRPVSDTNNDGQLDENDTCVPIGGFINSLRPINLAKPLIQQAAGAKPINGAPANTPPGKNPAPTPAAKGVLVSGYINDAATGKPIANAIYVVLKPGITWEKSTGAEDEVLEVAHTNKKGYFQAEVPLQRGVGYSIGLAADGYSETTEDDVKLETKTPDAIEVTFELDAQ